jgi:hypothetical protein
MLTSAAVAGFRPDSVVRAGSTFHTAKVVATAARYRPAVRHLAEHHS